MLPSPAERPLDVVGWTAELLAHVVDLVGSLRPGAPLPLRVRVHLSSCVVATAGGPVGRWVQDGRRAYVGPPPAGELLDALEAFAEASATAPSPVDATALAVRAGAPVAGAARGVVAAARMVGLAERSAWSAVARLRGRRPLDVPRLASELAMAAVVAPLALPAVVAGAGSRAVAAVAPSVPDVGLDEPAEANLVAHILADAVPELLGHAIVRTVVLTSPVRLVVAVRLHGSAASIEVGQGRVTVSDGIRPEAIAVIEGPLDSLVEVAVASVTRHVRSAGTTS